jgi:hypothetical protein
MQHASGHTHPYQRLFLMSLLSFVSMYILMYAMVDVFGNVYPNINQVYMAGLMTAPMVVIELMLMGAMYPNKSWNIAIGLITIVLGSMCFIFIRQQVGVGDISFLRSMIPHHASALLMCEHAELEDPGLVELCQNILTGQQAEIEFMKTKLEE